MRHYAVQVLTRVIVCDRMTREQAQELTDGANGDVIRCSDPYCGGHSGTIFDRKTSSYVPIEGGPREPHAMRMECLWRMHTTYGTYTVAALYPQKGKATAAKRRYEKREIPATREQDARDLDRPGTPSEKLWRQRGGILAARVVYFDSEDWFVDGYETPMFQQWEARMVRAGARADLEQKLEREGAQPDSTEKDGAPKRPRKKRAPKNIADPGGNAPVPPEPVLHPCGQCDGRGEIGYFGLHCLACNGTGIVA